MDLLKNIIFMVFVLMSVIFSSAIPDLLKPYSLADIIILAMSPMLIFYYNKKIFIYLICGLVTFQLSSLFGRLREFNVSELTSASLIAKWAGVLFVYYAITKNIRPSINLLIFITILQILVLISVFFDIKPFQHSYYGGSSGVFQASADGGYYILCFLGVFLHVARLNKSKIIYLNIFLASFSLLLIDSRFGAILGFVALTYSLLMVSGIRLIAILLFSFFLVLFTFDIVSLPLKLSELLTHSVGIRTLSGSDISLSIRIYNFDEALRMSDYWTPFIGNGGKFFGLTSTNFFDGNMSLDNSYLYLFLSFGIVGILIFYIIFISEIGLNLGRRGIFSFFALTFPLMQDVFSNSFNLLTFGIIVAFDTILYKHFYEMRVIAPPRINKDKISFKYPLLPYQNNGK